MKNEEKNVVFISLKEINQINKQTNKKGRLLFKDLC